MLSNLEPLTTQIFSTASLVFFVLMIALLVPAVRRWFKPEFGLRLGLGLMYLYSGLDLIIHPTAWHWAVRGLPQAIQDLIGQVGLNTFLQVQGGIELIFGLVFILWFLPARFPKWIAWFSALEMAAILAMVGIDAVTFRDFGILAASLGLFLLYQRRGD